MYLFISLDNLCLERDFGYARRGKLKGHGYSDQAIDDILSDKLLFIRHLMPEAESVLLCDKEDYRAIMDFLFYAISVCTERRRADCLINAFFNLAKNYGFSWRLRLKHIVTVLANYGIHQHVLDGSRCAKHLPKYKGQRSGKYKLEPHKFLSRRKKNGVSFVPLAEEKFTFCVSNFILVISEFTSGLPNMIDFRYKSDWSDLCVLAFLVNLLGTDQRFVLNLSVLDAISSMYIYLFDCVPSENWFCGMDEVLREGDRLCFTQSSFPGALAKIIHDFPDENEMDELRCWNIESRLSKVDNGKSEHKLNIIHKLGLFPPSYRGNQVRRFLAFYYLQTSLILSNIMTPDNPTVIDIAETSSIINSPALRLMWCKDFNDFSSLLVVVKLCNMIVGDEAREAFSKEKVPAILKLSKELLQKMQRKLPSVQKNLDGNNILTLAQLHSHLNVVIERWSTGCGGRD